MSKQEKQQLSFALGIVVAILLTLFEFKIQSFSPWIQIQETITVPLIITIGLLINIFFRKKIFANQTKSTNTDYLNEMIVSLVLGAVLTVPILGFISITNRTIGYQADYKLEGEIIHLDSVWVGNNATIPSSIHYSVEFIEKQSRKKYEFNISERMYQELKGKTEIELHVKKGFWGYLYDN